MKSEFNPLNRYLIAFFLSSLMPLVFAQVSSGPGASISGIQASIPQSEKDKIVNKNIIAIDKGCVTAALIVKNQLIDKQNNKFNLLATLDNLKTSQMAFIQKSTLTAFLVYIDALDPSDVNPPLMSSQYMLNCLSFVRH